jgi:ferredoxin-thioredoxin reductase catalytic subunit
MMDDDECGAVGGMSVRGKQKYLEKTCPCRFVHHKSHMT